MTSASGNERPSEGEILSRSPSGCSVVRGEPSVLRVTLTVHSDTFGCLGSKDVREPCQGEWPA